MNIKEFINRILIVLSIIISTSFYLWCPNIIMLYSGLIVYCAAFLCLELVSSVLNWIWKGLKQKTVP